MGLVTPVKILLTVYNVILALIGIGVMLFITFNAESSREELAKYVLCALILVFGLLGCYGAIRESVCLIVTCAFALLILAMLQGAVIYLDSIERGSRSGIATVETAWDFKEMNALQLEHECCGKDSAQDYVLLGREIPPSCYANQKANDSQALFIEGCSSKLEEHYHTEETLFFYTSLFLGAFEVIGFILSIWFVGILKSGRFRFLPVPT